MSDIISDFAKKHSIVRWHIECYIEGNHSIQDFREVLVKYANHDIPLEECKQVWNAYWAEASRP